MKALQIAAYGTNATLVDTDDVVAGPCEVVVDVTSASLNPLDSKIVSGVMREYFPVTFPYTLGTDIAGTLSAVGTDVTGWSIGDRVVARLDPSVGGAFADRVVVDAGLLVAAPATIALEVAAGIPTAAATAWQALTEVANVEPRQRVLVHAAAGGVGSFAVQFAHRLSAQVIATASGTGIDMAKKLGADSVIDYTQTKFEDQARDIDIVLDTVGGANEARSLDVLKPGGLLVAVPMPPDTARAESRGLRAEFVFHRSNAERLAKVVEQIDDGVCVLLDRSLPLSSGAQALAYLARGHAKGKVVLTAN